jgi:hypothetical protein
VLPKHGELQIDDMGELHKLVLPEHGEISLAVRFSGRNTPDLDR